MENKDNADIDKSKDMKNMFVFSEEVESDKDSASEKLSNVLSKANKAKEESVEFVKNHTPSVYIKKGKKEIEQAKDKANNFFRKVDDIENRIKEFHNSAPQITKKDNILNNGKGDIAKNIIALGLYIGAVFLWIFGHKFICIIIFILTTIFYVFTSYSLK